MIQSELSTEIVENKNGIPMTSSRVIADVFNKRHDNVVRDIKNLIETDTSILRSEYFIESVYVNRGKEYKEYLLTKDGFTILAMGFTGKKAMEFKIRYIKAFNEMEESLKQINTTLSNNELTTEEKIAEALILSQAVIAKTKDELVRANRNKEYNKKVNTELRREIKTLKKELDNAKLSTSNVPDDEIQEMKAQLLKLQEEADYWEGAYSNLEIKLDTKESMLNSLLKVKKDSKKYFNLLASKHAMAMPLTDDDKCKMKANVFRKDCIQNNAKVQYNNGLSKNFIDKISPKSLDLALLTYFNALKARLGDKTEAILGKDLIDEVESYIIESNDTIQEINSYKKATNQQVIVSKELLY